MSTISYEKKNKIAYITLNRPEVLNAMNNQMKKELAEIWFDFRDDPEVWIGVLSGAGGKAFSVGTDVKEIAEWNESHTGIFPIEPQPLQMGRIEIWKPIIAAIDGWCVGGGLELALVTDIRIATEHSQLGLMEPKVGAVSGGGGGGGTTRLPAQIPFAIAMEMLLTGDTINAKRAYEIGLINQVVHSSEELKPAIQKMVERILACAPIMVRVTKEQAMRGFNLPTSVALPLREVGMTKVHTSHDAREGAKAFAEKRKPVWTGT